MKKQQHIKSIMLGICLAFAALTNAHAIPAPTAHGDVSVQSDASWLLTTFSPTLKEPISGQRAVPSWTFDEATGIAGAMDRLARPRGGPDPDIGGYASEGSLLLFELDLAEAAIVSFDWNFLSNDRAGSANDFSFVTVFGANLSLASILGGVEHLSAASPVELDTFGTTRETGWSTTSLDLAAGHYRIGIGVTETQDYWYESALEVSPLRVPETMPLLFTGVVIAGVLMVGARRKR